MYDFEQGYRFETVEELDEILTCGFHIDYEIKKVLMEMKMGYVN